MAANLNCPGQVVISGEFEAIKEICILFNNMGAKRSIQLSVSGAFHSELMGDAKKELKEYINSIEFHEPICPIFQNVTGNGVIDNGELFGLAVLTGVDTDNVGATNFAFGAI